MLMSTDINIQEQVQALRIVSRRVPGIVSGDFVVVEVEFAHIILEYALVSMEEDG